MTSLLRLATATSLVALLVGCDALEPYQRPYAWHPTGVGESNLAAMAVDPADLIRGRGTVASDATAAAVAIDRLRHDRVKPLLDSNSLSNATPSSVAGLSAN